MKIYLNGQIQFSPPPQKKLLSKTLPEGSQILAKYESLQARSQLALFPIIIGCVGVVILPPPQTMQSSRKVKMHIGIVIITTNIDFQP